MSEIEQAIERLSNLSFKLDASKHEQFSKDLMQVIVLAKAQLEQKQIYEKMRAEVIRMRQYAQRKSIPIGECVAWCNIKKFYGAGESDQEDFAWLAAYEQEQKAKH